MKKIIMILAFFSLAVIIIAPDLSAQELTHSKILTQMQMWTRQGSWYFNELCLLSDTCITAWPGGGNITDTNATTECSGDEVLLGNSSCISSGSFAVDDSTFLKNDSNANFNILNITDTLFGTRWRTDSGLEILLQNNFYIQLYGDGDNDIINITQDISQASTGSISAWIKLDDVNDGYHTWMNWKENPADQNNYGALRIVDGNSGSGFDGQVNFISKQSAVDVNIVTGGARLYNDIWYHIVLTHNGSGYAIYIDGTNRPITILTGSPASTEWWDDYPATGTNWIMGTALYGGAIYTTITGKIDDVIIWERVLSQGEVTDLYNDGRNRQTFDDTNLIAQYWLNNNGDDQTGNFDITEISGADFIAENELQTNVSVFRTDGEFVVGGDLTAEDVTIKNRITSTGHFYVDSGGADYMALVSDDYDYAFYAGGDIVLQRSILPYNNNSINIGSGDLRMNEIHASDVIYGSPFYEGDALRLLSNTKAKPDSISNDWGEADIDTYPEGFRVQTCWNETAYKEQPFIDPMGIEIIIEVPYEVEKCIWALSAFGGQQMLIQAIKQLNNEVERLEGIICKYFPLEIECLRV